MQTALHGKLPAALVDAVCTAGLNVHYDMSALEHVAFVWVGFFFSLHLNVKHFR